MCLRGLSSRLLLLIITKLSWRLLNELEMLPHSPLRFSSIENNAEFYSGECFCLVLLSVICGTHPPTTPSPPFPGHPSMPLPFPTRGPFWGLTLPVEVTNWSSSKALQAPVLGEAAAVVSAACTQSQIVVLK